MISLVKVKVKFVPVD